MWSIVALPFAASILSGISALFSAQYKRSEPRGLIIFISQISVTLSLFGIVLLWYVLYKLEAASPSVISGAIFSWKGFLDQPLDFGLKADQLSITIAFMIAFVGVLTNLYSIGFLARERKISGFFSLLNMAYSFLLMLIFVDSFFFFFVLWQLVAVIGLAFMTGFFSRRDTVSVGYYISEACSSAAFLFVMFLIWKAFVNNAELNTDIFQYNSIQAGSELILPYSGIISLAVLLAIIARSAQFPFYVWSPGATATPFPAYAFMYFTCTILISVYLLLRINFLLVLSMDVIRFAAVIGAIVALYGTLSALVQKNVKKLIAYFSISQMGLALMGIGVGAFESAVFHVFTYAAYVTSICFGIGSVMFITGSDDVRQHNLLRKYLPVTFWTTLVGVISASGIYPFAGFYGKNGIIWEVYQRGHGWLFLAALLSGILGAIALFRMIGLTFFGKALLTDKKQPRIEESSVSMLTAMVIMAFASLVIGWFGVSFAFGGVDHFGSWIRAGIATQMVHVLGDKGRFSELVLAVIVTLLVVHAGLVTWIIYVHKKRWPNALLNRFPRTNSFLENGFYINHIYEKVIIKPVCVVSEWVLSKGLDDMLVNNIVVGFFGRNLRLNGELLVKIKARHVQTYLLWLIVCLIVVIGWYVF